MHVSDSQAISTFKKKRKKRVLYLWRLKEALLLRYIWACQYSCFNSSPVRVYCVAKLERVWHEKNRFEFHASLTSRLHESQWSLWILVICVASVWCWKTNTRHIRVHTQLTCRTINFEKGVIFSEYVQCVFQPARLDMQMVWDIYELQHVSRFSLPRCREKFF